MAEKLSIQIALDGGAEIERQLANIGAAGQKAFADISKSAEKVGFKNIKPEEVTAKLQEMGVTGVDAIDKIQRAVQQAGRLEGLVSGIATAENALLAMAKAAPIVGVAVVAAMTAAVKATIKFAETIQKASAEAVKLGLTLEQFQKQQQGLEKLGLSMKSAAEGLASLVKAADAAKLTAVTRAFIDLQEAATRGFGGVGTQQLKTLEEAAKGIGPAADFARAKLVELGFAYQQIAVEFGKPFPEGAVRSLQNFIIQTGSAEAGMQAFLANLRQMPPSLDRTRLAIAGLGEAAGIEFVQGLRLAEGSMGSTEAKAEQLRQATNGLSSAWANFGSLTFSPAIVQGLNLATAALQGLDTLLSQVSWSAFGTTAFVALNPLPNLLELLGRAIVELGSKLSGDFWSSFATAAVTSWNQIISVVQSAGTAITTFVSSLTGITWDAISNAGVAAWNAITGAIQGAIASLLRFLGLQSRTPAPAPKAADGGQFARGGLLGGRGSGTSDSNLAWLSRGEFVINAAAVRHFGANFFAALNARKQPRFAAGGLAAGGQVPIAGIAFPGGAGDKTLLAIEQNTQVLTKLVQTVDALVRKFDETFQMINEKFDNLDQKIDGLGQKIDSLAQQVAALAQAIGQKSGKALGGLLGGRGTGTSDSNLAWVSRGEHIMPAHTVAQPGVLAFLEALRRSGGNLRGVLDGMGRFALGGMIRGPMPAIGGLRASSDVVDQLHRAAALAQVRSGGRKPSRYS